MLASKQAKQATCFAKHLLALLASKQSRAVTSRHERYLTWNGPPRWRLLHVLHWRHHPNWGRADRHSHAGRHLRWGRVHLVGLGVELRLGHKPSHGDGRRSRCHRRWCRSRGRYRAVGVEINQNN